MTSADPIRVPLLMQLAEQAMSDLEFRAIAREDIECALKQYGYDLNPREQALVTKFRASLADAGVDLSLSDEFSLADIELLRTLSEEMIEREVSAS